MEAHLMFANLSQPKCGKGHTNIRVQRVGSLEEDYSRREDEEAESEITVSESFYLNMSNCMAERGDFSVVTKITLQKSTSKRTFYKVTHTESWFCVNCETFFKSMSECGLYGLTDHSDIMSAR